MSFDSGDISIAQDVRSLVNFSRLGGKDSGAMPPADSDSLQLALFDAEPVVGNSTAAESRKQRPIADLETPAPKRRERKSKPSPEQTSNSLRTVAPAFAEQRYASDVELAARWGVSRPTIWRWVKSIPEFPKPIKLSTGTTRWRLEDVHGYEAKRARR